MRAFGASFLVAVAIAQPITLQPCNRVASEVFVLNADQTITAPGGQCVGISGGNVAALSCSGDATQKWTWLSNGCVSSVADSTSCWNAWSGQTSPGTPIEMYACGSREPSVAQNDLFYYDAAQSHIIGNESSLCFATATVPPGPPPPCESDMGCSLNGKCDTTAGTCTCYEPWVGVDCGQLDILPAPPVRGYGMVPDIYTWGGSVALLDDGVYHMYVAEMSGNCSLNSWGSNSLVTHATSPVPEGPFVRQDTALPVWSHNPQVVVQKNTSGGNATLVLFHIGDANNGPVKNCSASVDPATGGSLADAAADGATSPGSTLHFATNPFGPWTPVIPSPPSCNNPAPFLHPNGTWYLFCSSSFYSAPSFFGPWSSVPFVAPRNPEVSGSYEDPVLFVDPRGYWHIIWHVYTTSPVPPTCVNSTVSGHWFSEDGIVWTGAASPPFPNTIPITDGTTTLVSTRERPKILFNAAGDPTHLYNGVCATLSCAPIPCVNCKYQGKTYTNAVPLNVAGNR